MDRKKRLITSALPYVNNVPHLGNIIGCVLSADVYARFCRMKGYETLYICGTDEHGTATEQKAIEEGVTPQEICDKYFEIHKRVYDWFGISFDAFGRTSKKIHHTLTQEIFNEINRNGYIIEQPVDQLFCPSCIIFLADRFVEGVCPHCQKDGARGDQCDHCGHLIDAPELIDPKCKRCGTTPQIKSVLHLFLDLPQIGDDLKAWTEKQAQEGSWPANAATLTEAWFKEGLKPRCITRDLSWGVQVPVEGFNDKVFYVWFDAPIGYISITADHFSDWQDWWKGKDVQLYQFMAKDNIPFHTIIFPASLLAAKQGWTMLHHIASTEYLNYEDGKFSKSKGVGVFGDNAIESGIPPDVWRYYLLTNRPETSDTAFSWLDFQEKTNHELLANLGNFVNRTLTFLKKNFDGEVCAIDLNEEDEGFFYGITDEIEEVTKLLDAVQLKDGLRKIMMICKSCNGYFQRMEPWKLIKEDRERSHVVLSLCANLARSLAILVRPYLPFTSDEIFTQLGIDTVEDWNEAFELSLPSGHKIGEPAHIFAKLEDKTIKELREKYSGAQVKEEKKDVKSGDSESEDADTFSRLDLRVAKIMNVEKHPDADKLYIIQVDVGELGKRQIVSGLVKHYEPAELRGKNVIIVANLAPAKLRGVESKGMLLCAEDEDETYSQVLEAPDANPGDRVTIEDGGDAPMSEITYKVFSKVKMKLSCGIVMHGDKKLVAGGKGLVVHGVMDGDIV